MKRLPLSALQFTATAEIVTGADGHPHRKLHLHYRVVHKTIEADLISIVLEDSKPIDVNAGSPFWFYFQPVAQNLGLDRPLLRIYPSIDLIVLSSVKVSVRRFKKHLDLYQVLGFEDLDPQASERDAVFSPVRPKISLRRVHRANQIPLAGTPFALQTLKPDCSFFVSASGEEHYTTRSSLADLLRRGGAIDADDVLVPRRTWTRVFYGEHFTEFHFLESGYHLRVFDQGYDLVDGKLLSDDGTPGTLTQEEARSRQHEAERLISLPKFFDWKLAFDEHPILMKGGYQAEYRTNLTITKSGRVFFVGNCDRNSDFDKRTNALQSRTPRPGDLRGGTNYRDYLPSVFILDEGGRSVPFGDLELSWPEAQYSFEKSDYHRFLELQFSVVVGFTPILGEVFGLYEIYTALQHNEDAFGNRLDDTGKVLVVLGGILPFIPSSVLLAAFRGARSVAFPLLAGLLVEKREDLSELEKIQAKL